MVNKKLGITKTSEYNKKGILHSEEFCVFDKLKEIWAKHLVLTSRWIIYQMKHIRLYYH